MCFFRCSGLETGVLAIEEVIAGLQVHTPPIGVDRVTIVRGHARIHHVSPFMQCLVILYNIDSLISLSFRFADR